MKSIASGYCVLGLLLIVLSCGTDVERRSAAGGGDATGDVTGGTGTTGGSSTNLGLLAAPTITPPGGSFARPVTATVAASEDTLVRCTQDGVEPNVNSPEYTGPFEVKTTSIVRCRAYKSGFSPSAVTDAVFVIDSNLNDPNDPPPTKEEKIRIEISYVVDATDRLRVENGMMDLIHVNGQRPGNPWVKLTYADGHSVTINVWDLSPFHEEAGIACNWTPDECVSAGLDLGLPASMVAGSDSIVAGSLIIGTARGSVSIDGAHQVLFQDPQSSFSGYWVAFDYSYRVPVL